MFIQTCDYLAKRIKPPTALQCFDMSLHDLLQLFTECVKANHSLSKMFTKKLKNTNDTDIPIVYHVKVYSNNDVCITACGSKNRLDNIDFVIHVNRGREGIDSYVEKQTPVNVETNLTVTNSIIIPINKSKKNIRRTVKTCKSGNTRNTRNTRKTCKARKSRKDRKTPLRMLTRRPFI